MMGKKRNYEKHGETKTDTYLAWKNMRYRCNYKKSSFYKYYGGRGITVCDEWDKSFSAFLSDMGERPKNATLDRINNDKGYFKENCRWISQEVQTRNRDYCKAARLVDPNGVRHVIKKGFVGKFCKENELHSGGISMLLRGKWKTHKGWTGKYL